MDEPKTKRNKKSDKQKKTYEKNGSFSQKHVRMAESLMAQAQPKAQAQP